MTVKGILFNTEMVRAILDGRKTCTRRIVKPQITAHYGAQCIKPPYQPGDILYVRETWCGWYLPLVGMHYCYRATEPDGNKRPTSPEYDCDVEKISWCPSIHMPKEATRIWLKVTDVRVERLQDITEDGAEAESIPDWCPLKPLPEKMTGVASTDHWNSIKAGWNACIDEIAGGD